MRQIDLKGEAEALRPGHSCNVTLPTKTLEIRDANGAINYHVPIDFDDGVCWLARVRQLSYDSPPAEITQKLLDSEIATIQTMHQAGLKVPDVFESLSSGELIPSQREVHLAWSIRRHGSPLFLYGEIGG